LAVKILLVNENALLRWSDMARGTHSIKNAIIIPYDLKDFSKPLPLNGIPPHALKYFKVFESQLLDRALYKRYLLPFKYPFYTIYNVGNHSLYPFKVCWQTMGEKLRATVISASDLDGKLCSQKPIVPQHAIVYIPLSDRDEAHYVCSLMNSSPAQFIAQSYSMGKSFGNPHIMDYIKIPRYVPDDKVHQELSQLSQECHEKVAAGISVTDLEEQIDELAAELWGLTKEELKDIKESLEEMK